jgi:hypothetical protein
MPLLSSLAVLLDIRNRNQATVYDLAGFQTLKLLAVFDLMHMLNQFAYGYR